MSNARLSFISFFFLSLSSPTKSLSPSLSPFAHALNLSPTNSPLGSSLPMPSPGSSPTPLLGSSPTPTDNSLIDYIGIDVDGTKYQSIGGLSRAEKTLIVMGVVIRVFVGSIMVLIMMEYDKHK